jgi:integrase
MPDDASEQRGKPRGRHPDKRLTVPAVNSAGPGFHADGNGLYLAVDESGARRWILRTLVHGRRRDIGLGGAATIRLAEAREFARRLRRVARDGGDPIAERDRDKLRSPSFEDAARTVHAEHVAASAKNGKHVAQWMTTLETYAFPVIGAKPVHAVEQADVLRILAPIWTEKPETARRVKQRLKTVLDWASTAGHRSGVNPVEGVEKGLARQRDRTRHFAALPWRELPALMRRLSELGGMGALALRFTILTAARSGEVRGATWDEIDLAEAVWTIPARRMKAGTVHRVPLSAPALAVLEAASAQADGSRLSQAAQQPGLVFPAPRARKPLSDMTLAAVLKRLAIAPEVATVHGFRSSFRDWAEEATNFPHEVKETALAHAVKSKVEAAYRRTDLFEKRRDMMATWGAFVQPIG